MSYDLSVCSTYFQAMVICKNYTKATISLHHSL